MGDSMIAIRGATTCCSNSQQEVLDKTAELLKLIIERNHLNTADIISIIFTGTPDITAAFPAQAARLLCLTDIPLLGAQELSVEGAPALCIRVMIHTSQGIERDKVIHVYLHGAKSLRPDLAREDDEHVRKG